MKTQTKIQFPTVRSFAEDAAFYRIMSNPNNPVNTNYSISSRFFTDIGRMTSELFGRLVQNYPGEFIEEREKELSRYPRYYRTR